MDCQLIYEAYMNSGTNKLGHYAYWGMVLKDPDNVPSEGYDAGDHLSTVEENLFQNEWAETAVWGNDEDKEMFEYFLRNIHCDLNSTPLTIKGKYETAIKYCVRLNSLLDNAIYIVTADPLYSTWEKVEQNKQSFIKLGWWSMNQLIAAPPAQDFTPKYGLKYIGVKDLIWEHS